MTELERDPAAHLSLATSLEQSARFNQSAALYRRAMKEYDAAIGLDPSLVEGLDQFAYTYWLWRLSALAGIVSEGPTAEDGMLAERRAREGLRLATLHSSRQSDQFDYQGTLGETLLGQGRIAEAMNNLEKVIGDQIPWWGLQESRWDLALANLCLAAGTKSRSGAPAQAALALFQKIRAGEASQDLRWFTSLPLTLDPLFLTSWCPKPAPAATPPRFTMRVQYSAGPGCQWTGVTAVGRGLGEGAYFLLHAWGGGVDGHIPLSSSPPRSITLEVPSKNQQFDYFARLEDNWGNPHSDAFAFATRAGCASNLVTLTFEPSAPPPAKRGASK